MTYSISFTDSFNATPPPGKTIFAVPDYRTEGPAKPSSITLNGGEFSSNTAHTSLLLLGKGVPNYGEVIQKNLIYLLENFASSGTPPAYPTVGQMWFDYSSLSMNIYKDTGTWDSLVWRSGGNMTGVLTLFSDPTGPMEAVTKQYTDSKFVPIIGNVEITGPILGQLMLDEEPTTAMSVATKGYVDTTVNTHPHLTDNTKHLTSSDRIFLDGITASPDEINFLVGVTTSVQNQLNDRLQLSGGVITGALTVTGPVTLNTTPSQNFDAVNKLYVDSHFLRVPASESSPPDNTAYALTDGSRGRFAAIDHLHEDTAGYQDTNTSTVKLLITDTSGLFESVLTDPSTFYAFDISVDGGPIQNIVFPVSGTGVYGLVTYEDIINTLNSGLMVGATASLTYGILRITSDTIGLTSSIDITEPDTVVPVDEPKYLFRWLDGSTGVSLAVNGRTGYVSSTGDTMTGLLILSGDPLVALGAATKQYVDTGLSLKIDKAGDTMTGALILDADPSALLGAATKQYVDIGLSGKSDTSHHHDAVYINASGDTMTGALILDADPSALLGAATKQYVDNSANTKVTRSLVTSTGQSVFTTPTYVIGTDTLWVFVQGIKAYEGAAESYTETSTTSVTFTYVVPNGVKVEFLVFGA
jgi:hypothetical protein